jgi:hypothetical protein
MKQIQEKIDNILDTIKIQDLKSDKNIMTEQKSPSSICSREDNEQIRFVFNSNPQVKHTFRNGIDRTLKEVFKDKYEFKDDGTSGVYNLETEGRSVLNKLNTNYSCFCVLLKDINKLLEKQGVNSKISIVSEPPAKQVSETKRMVDIIQSLGDRIFSPSSNTFKNIMSILQRTHDLGEKRENFVLVKLQKKFGNDNVKKIGGIGSKEDMVSGIDMIIIVDGEKFSAQVKPMGSMEKEDEQITVFGTGGVKNYSTEWMIFTKGTDIYVFDNDNTKIVGGNYVFPASALIYSL